MAFHVYIATNIRNTVLYTGVTNDIYRRIAEHAGKLMPGFTSRYNICKLVYCEEFQTPIEAIRAEKKIKGWTRQRKVGLIEDKNPEWKDLLKQ